MYTSFIYESQLTAAFLRISHNNISLSLSTEKARQSNEKQKSTKCNNDGYELIDNNHTEEEEVDLSNLEDELNFNSTSNSSNNNYHLNPNSYQPSLIKALYNAFGYDFLRAGLFKLIHDSSLFVGPQVLNRLIQFLRDKDAPLSYGISLMLIGKFFLYESEGVCLFVYMF